MEMIFEKDFWAFYGKNRANVEMIIRANYPVECPISFDDMRSELLIKLHDSNFLLKWNSAKSKLNTFFTSTVRLFIRHVLDKEFYRYSYCKLENDEHLYWTKDDNTEVTQEYNSSDERCAQQISAENDISLDLKDFYNNIPKECRGIFLLMLKGYSSLELAEMDCVNFHKSLLNKMSHDEMGKALNISNFTVQAKIDIIRKAMRKYWFNQELKVGSTCR
jgi:DNA-directed RNA polymerase specialized sigma24 family protein